MHFIPKAAFPTFQAAVTAQVQQQVEALLYAAYKLELVQLAEVVEGYIRYQVTFVSSILRGQLRPIMSERVMAAAAGFKQLQESLLLSRWCTAPCALFGGAPKPFTQRMMAPTAPCAVEKPLSLSAVMLEEFMALPKGATVDIGLDLGVTCLLQALATTRSCWLGLLHAVLQMQRCCWDPHPCGSHRRSISSRLGRRPGLLLPMPLQLLLQQMVTTVMMVDGAVLVLTCIRT